MSDEKRNYLIRVLPIFGDGQVGQPIEITVPLDSESAAGCMESLYESRGAASDLVLWLGEACVWIPAALAGRSVIVIREAE